MSAACQRTNVIHAVACPAISVKLLEEAAA
ncbi:hypothetical protein ATK30_2870 [Amycolatopsis echigonensis]|uniref:Uncharacterized protein n=1 Tax=Amycolatopsis echigonensis TaxID=2576905 RepID=A0A2N3WDY7_9PSEU|nr:hypothetical protein ATK30_2870 [Amycolatopsis niigatensis]